ncbi:hypothetical protein [Pseudomonas asplenii]|uniref:hypothetical protein n=1 Tax=Pseudomonas asplenii TaxID=53407 RepID=UPI003CCAF070
MCYNALAGNSDDHPRNHAIIWTGASGAFLRCTTYCPSSTRAQPRHWRWPWAEKAPG